MRSSRQRRSSRAFGYLLVPLTGLLSPLIALPAITAHHGALAWAALATGQSIGMAASALGELGWGLNGPQRVAPMRARNSYQTLILSLQTKLLAFVPLSVLVGMIAYALTADFKAEASVIAIASLAGGLNAVWFFLGRSQPWNAILTDGVPRIVGVLAGAILVVAGGSLMTYAWVGLMMPCVIGPVLGLIVARTRAAQRTRLFRPAQVTRAIRAQASAFTARLVSAMYIALPVTLVSLVSPASVPVFAAGERLMRLLLAAMASVPNGMHGWIGVVTGQRARWNRIRLALWVNLGLGLAAASAFGLLAPFASSLIFSGKATIPSQLSWVMALVIVVVSVSRATGNLALVALRRVRVIMWSAMAGALVGVPAITVFTALLGPVGGAAGELVAEAVVLAVQVRGIAKNRPVFEEGQR